MVSCIVTTYKRNENILKRALDSIVGQTYKDIEVIVVNDAPEMIELSKKIEKLVQSYEVPITYIVHERNKGACEARNTGIEISKGEYIAFLDDDDEWLPNKLEIQLKKMEETDAGLVYCAFYNVDAKGIQTLKGDLFRPDIIIENNFRRLLGINYIGSTSFPLLRADVVKEVGGFNTMLKSSQDYDLWLRIAKNSIIAYCEEALVRYYYSEEAISRSMSNKIQGYEYILNQYKNYYQEDKELLNYKYNVLSCDCLMCYSYKWFISYWIRAMRVNVLSKNNLLFIYKIISRCKKRAKALFNNH